jgi:hypothetical protein
VNCTIFPAHRGNPFQPAPSPIAESSPERFDLSDSRGDSYRLFDPPMNLEILILIVTNANAAFLHSPGGA